MENNWELSGGHTKNPIKSIHSLISWFCSSLRIRFQVRENSSITSLHRCCKNSQMIPWFCFDFLSFATSRAASLKAACRRRPAWSEVCPEHRDTRRLKTQPLWPWVVPDDRDQAVLGPRGDFLHYSVPSALGVSTWGLYPEARPTFLRVHILNHSAAESHRSWWSRTKCPTFLLGFEASHDPDYFSSLFFIMSHSQLLLLIKSHPAFLSGPWDPNITLDWKVSFPAPLTICLSPVCSSKSDSISISFL